MVQKTETDEIQPGCQALQHLFEVLYHTLVPRFYIQFFKVCQVTTMGEKVHEKIAISYILNLHTNVVWSDNSNSFLFDR
jgi:hypothetical protein